jgi:hypothetical protein
MRQMDTLTQVTPALRCAPLRPMFSLLTGDLVQPVAA